MYDSHRPVTWRDTASQPASVLTVFPLRIFLLDWGVLWHFKGHQPATRRAVGTGIPTGNIGDHLGKRTKRLGLTARDNTIKQNSMRCIPPLLVVLLAWGQRKDKWNLTNSRENASFAPWVFLETVYSLRGLGKRIIRYPREEFFYLTRVTGLCSRFSLGVPEGLKA